jgi:serine protease
MSKAVVFALSSLALAACVGVAPPEPTDQNPGDGNHDEITFTSSVHAMPFVDQSSLRPFTAPSGAHLTYYGGKVVQAAKVVQVLYGSGTYVPQVSATSGTSMGSFYGQSLTIGVWDWLSEYNTSSPSQSIGRGSFGGQVQISPSSSHNGSTITDASIQAELAAQINSNVLPAPSDNVIYMINFPAGKKITDPSGSGSCVSGGFCAYHGTMKIGSQNVYYGVLPDMGPSSGCATGCGGSTTFNNQTSVASHELIETVTDAEVGLSTTVGPPLAWYDTTNGEIGDICNAQQGTFVGSDGVTYTIQQEFSNQQNNCITTRSTTTSPDFSVAVSPASATVAPSATTSFSVTTSAIAGSTQTVALTVAGLPSGVTGSFSPSSVTAGGSSTLTLTASASATGSSTFTVKGTSGATTHTATGMVTVSGGGGGGGGGGALSNGVPVTGLSGATGAQANYTIAVPAGQSTLTVTISGGTGDADLYVKAGSAPTLTTYDCRPYVNGNSETCTFSNPAAGTWYIMLNGYATYSGVTLTATYGADTTSSLGNNVPVSGVSGATGSQQYWKITVPAGQTQLVVHTSGGTGDVDLYVKKGSKPTTATYDCRPYINGNTETCTFSSPAASDYYVMLRGYATYSGVTLVAHYP